MKKIALFSVIALSALMVGCSSTETRDYDAEACDTTALCEDVANCDPSTCEKPNCPKKTGACATKATKAAGCPTEGMKKMDCGTDCTKPCCAE